MGFGASSLGFRMQGFVLRVSSSGLGVRIRGLGLRFQECLVAWNSRRRRVEARPGRILIVRDLREEGGAFSGLHSQRSLLKGL